VPSSRPSLARHAGGAERLSSRHAEAVDDAAQAGGSVRFGSVLVPLDGSDFALAAVPTARALAARFGASVATISVARDERDAEELRRHAAEELGSEVGEDAVAVVVGGDPASAITGRAEELGSCLVCMSSRGRGRVAGALIGSVAQGVLVASKAPVVVVGPAADRPDALVGRPPRRPAGWPEPLSVGGIVACVDGTPAGEAVVEVAAGWATALAMPLSILTVAEDAHPSVRTGQRPNAFGPPAPEAYVEELVTRWAGSAPDVVGEVVIDPVSVASGIRQHLAIRPAALVAVATRARRGLDRVRLGSVAADIVRSSTAPALVVPAPEG
jgi:nucleotide-binding universal stress UspA family protein